MLSSTTLSPWLHLQESTQFDNLQPRLKLRIRLSAIGNFVGRTNSMLWQANPLLRAYPLHGCSAFLAQRCSPPPAWSPTSCPFWPAGGCSVSSAFVVRCGCLSFQMSVTAHFTGLLPQDLRQHGEHIVTGGLHVQQLYLACINIKISLKFGAVIDRTTTYGPFANHTMLIWSLFFIHSQDVLMFCEAL